MKRTPMAAWLGVFLAATLVGAAPAADDPLPSWNDGKSKQAIVNFVARVTKEGGAEFVPPAARIAVFDNDGTLWCEQPLYVQAFFALERVKVMAPQHPEWKTKAPFAAILRGDREAMSKFSENDIAALMFATHSGMTTNEFATIAGDWLATAKHPKFKRPFTELAYQPMLEVLAYLRANGFKTYIVSGGGVDFMRPFANRVYGVPPEQVIGSSGKTKFELREGKPVLVKLPELGSLDDKTGKPENIELHIGLRPIAAFGNSDGDLQMLQWTTMSDGPRLGVIVHHTDAEREYAYDRESHVGHLAEALDQAPERGWTVVSMKDDWKTIFAKPAAP